MSIFPVIFAFAAISLNAKAQPNFKLKLIEDLEQRPGLHLSRQWEDTYQALLKFPLKDTHDRTPEALCMNTGSNDTPKPSLLHESEHILPCSKP